MATTSNTYTGNGSNKLFSITFPYLDTSDIDVYLNGTLQTIITQYTFANATTVEFVAAPANGAAILLDRSLMMLLFKLRSFQVHPLRQMILMMTLIKSFILPKKHRIGQLQLPVRQLQQQALLTQP
jgi:hypothetical protein